MSNYFDQFDAAPEQPPEPAPADSQPAPEPQNFFDRFDDAPPAVVPPAAAQQQPAPTQPATEPQNYFDQFDKEQETQGPEAEGLAATVARRAAHSAVPTIGSVLTAGAVGATIGGPIGFAAGIGTAMASGYVLDSFQERALKALGVDDSAQLRANAEENPKSDVVGGLVPLVVSFGASLTEKLASYLLRGGIMGGINIGQQLAEKGEVDPFEAGMNTAAGALLAKPRGFFQPYKAGAEKAGAAVGTAVGKAFRPGHPGDAAPGAVDDRAAADANDVTTNAAGIAAENGPVVTPKPGTVGQPVNQWDYDQILAGSRREFHKDENVISSTDIEKPGPPKSGKTGFTTGDIDPATASVLNPDYVAPSDQPNVDQPRQPPISDTLPDLQGEHAKAVLDATHEGMQNVGQGSRGELPADAFDPPANKTLPKQPYPGAEEASIPPNAKPTMQEGPAQSNFDAQLKAAQSLSEARPQAQAAPVQEQSAAQQPPVARPRARPTTDQAISALPKLDMKGGTPLPDNSPFKEALGTIENLKAGIDKARENPGDQTMREAADHAQKHYDNITKANLVAETVARLRAAGGKYTKVADDIAAMAPGPKQIQAAAKMNAGMHNQSGGVKNPTAEIKNPRIRNDQPRLNIADLKNAAGKPIKGNDLEDARIKTQAIRATEAVVNAPPEHWFPKFEPRAGESRTDAWTRATAGETDAELRTRAKNMLVEAANHNGGENPLKTYTLNGVDKPREWSLLREAQKLIRGKGHTTPEKFRTNELLHRGTDEQYESFKASNKAEADRALNPRKGDEAVAGAEAQQAKIKASAPEEEQESLRDRRLREEKEDRESDVNNAFKGDLSGSAPDKTTEKYLAAAEEKPAIEKSAKQITDEATAATRAKMAALKAKRLAKANWDAMSEAEKIAAPQKNPETMTRDQMPKTDLETATEKLKAGIDKQIKDNPAGSAAPGERQTLAMRRPKKNLGDTLKDQQAERAAKANEAVQERLKGGVGAPAEVPAAVNKSLEPKGGLFKKIFAPETVSKDAEGAAGLIRSKGGVRARDLAIASNRIEPFRKQINQAPEADKVEFMKAMDTGKDAGRFQPLAKVLNDAFGNVKSKLEALPSMAKQEFVTNYFPHMFENAKAAKEFVNSYYDKQGSAASLHERTMPTIQDGLNAGLKLATTDPLEVSSRYLASMHSFIEATDILDTAKDAGIVKFFDNKTVGASGSGTSLIPEGYAPLLGRGGPTSGHGQGYAPEDWARVYNNYISQGFHGNAESGKVFDALQHTSNSVTALELGLSGYHAFTMAKEAIISDFAKGISQVMSGDISKGAKSIAKSIAAPVTSYKQGYLPQQQYLGLHEGTPEMQKVVDLMTRSGARMIGARHDPTYKFSAEGSFFTAWKRGALKLQLDEAINRVKDAGEGDAVTVQGVANQGIQAGKELFRVVGRTLETVAQPLFQKYIPQLKNGAFYDTLSEWVSANPHATDEQSVAMARKIGDSIDNRFGEMVQDNIFWNKAMKQSAQLAMRSYSWNLGTVREIGGGALSLLTDPSRLKLSHPDYDPRAAYTVAMPVVMALTSMAYQYLKTGEGPHDSTDLMAGRTGGKTIRGNPERAMLPGYEKDVYGWFHDPSSEARNKLSTAPRLVWETLANKDYKNDPIANANDPFVGRMGQYLGHVIDSLGPISYKQITKGEKFGSNITLPERATAIRPAPTWMTDPDTVNNSIRKSNSRQWKLKEYHDKRENAAYGQ